MNCERHYNSAVLAKAKMIEVDHDHNDVVFDVDCADVIDKTQEDAMSCLMSIQSDASHEVASGMGFGCYKDYCCSNVMILDTDIQCAPGKWRFRGGHLEVYLLCSVPAWNCWYTLYQEPLLLPLLSILKRSQVIGTPERYWEGGRK